MNSTQVFGEISVAGNLTTMLQVPPNCDLTLGLTRSSASTGPSNTWQARIDERFLNPAGVVQGGFLAAIADSAMGAAAVSAAGGRKVIVANTDLRISFLRPVAPGSVVSCTARVIKSGRSITFVESTIVDQSDEVVATASSTYVIQDRAV